jgi:myosin heavy subunit
MLETIRIRKLGYPIRWVFQDFWDRFKLLNPKLKYPTQTNQMKKRYLIFSSQKVGNAAIISKLMESAKTKYSFVEHSWQVGLTKIFMKDQLVRKFALDFPLFHL